MKLDRISLAASVVDATIRNLLANTIGDHKPLQSGGGVDVGFYKNLRFSGIHDSKITNSTSTANVMERERERRSRQPSNVSILESCFFPHHPLRFLHCVETIKMPFWCDARNERRATHRSLSSLRVSLLSFAVAYKFSLPAKKAATVRQNKSLYIVAKSSQLYLL